jgi:ankyrin repeat protein
MPPCRFRWVFCQLDALRQCLPSSVRRTLKGLPESLDGTYERIVKDIKKGNQADAYRMLQCLTVAIRPLYVAELAELLAFEFDVVMGGTPKLNADWRWKDHEQAVLSTCSSLITIVGSGGSGVVQFSHFSVKEFLLSDRLATSTKDISRYHIVPADAHTLIARACLGVLLCDPVDQKGADDDSGFLTLYAAEYWVTHALVENVAPRIRDGMERLFNPEEPFFCAWVELYDVAPHKWTPSPPIQAGAAPSYYAAFCGFHGIVEHLTLKYPQYTNVIGGDVGTTLHAASDTGHVEVVRSLLRCGADVNARGYWDQSPLQRASRSGHLMVVQCLLEHGADANFQDRNLFTPLSHAVLQGHFEIVGVLLEHNADVDLPDKYGFTLLHNASTYSKGLEIVRLLLKFGANPNARNNKRQTPLHLVSSWGRMEAAHILLAHGADVYAEDENGRTPLQVASAREDELVRLLSEYTSSD